MPHGLRYGKYVKPYLPYFIFGPLLMIVEVLGEVVMPRLLAYIIDYGVNNQLEDMPGWLRVIYEWCRTSPDATNGPFVVAMAVGMGLTAIIMMIGGVGGAWFGSLASVNFAADLRADIYRKVQSFSFSNIDKFNTGSLVTRLTNDVTQLQNFVNTLLRMALRAPGMLIGALIMVIIMDAEKGTRMSLILAIAVPILAVGIALFIWQAFPRFTKMQTKVDGLNANVQESITNVRVIKSFVREDYELDKFAATNADLKQTGRSAFLVLICMSPLMSLIMNTVTLTVLWFGGQSVLAGEMTTGDLTAFITYITQVLSSLMMVTMLLMQLARAIASSKRIREVMEEESDISDADAAQPGLTVTRGDIEFRHVTFRYYKESEGKVLDDVSLTIEGGSTVGIIGSTGSGKTTLVSMIPRLYDADEGDILVDGVNVKDYSLYNLREGVGMVLQKNVLFSGTIGDNLRWGDEEADLDTVRRAAASAQADGFIMSFKDGYDSELGQGGANVSGGQKQRLCIARALLKRPKILILDDSTSAVDTATEARIRRAFREELKDTTKIIIAQRISSVREADRIIVVNEGKITGIGTHDELLETNAEYREIYESQESPASTSAPAPAAASDGKEVTVNG
ncbi:MAG: ABC transporter ATP-binding protein/permease [Clostridia bacterium]|nr:ABC transporter ATP-binding protein/permease [Clostridia bacterium]